MGLHPLPVLVLVHLLQSQKSIVQQSCATVALNYMHHISKDKGKLLQVSVTPSLTHGWCLHIALANIKALPSSSCASHYLPTKMCWRVSLRSVPEFLFQSTYLQRRCIQMRSCQAEQVIIPLPLPFPLPPPRGLLTQNAVQIHRVSQRHSTATGMILHGALSLSDVYEHSYKAWSRTAQRSPC